MSYYVAFPVHLLDELLALLPSNERSVYAERFERIAGNLVWLREDVQNALDAALTGEDDPFADADDPNLLALREDPDARCRLLEKLMDVDNDALTALVQDALTTLATDLVRQATLPVRPPDPRIAN